MKKLQAARDCLLLSGLPVDAEKLLTFAEKGVVISHPGAAHHNRDFQVRYTAHLILTDFVGEPLDLFFVMVEWLADECPGTPPDALHFHVDVLGGGKVDVSLMVELNETVTAAAAPAGTTLRADTDPNALHATLFPGLG